ncbi:MAG: TIGR01777 family protein [Propionibacterium sp.]|nr:TIGR01777 family protein [Propionibacterium sp.]HMQ38811.1 TIGR01777 family oxidoreductase [Micropruina sp.]
MRITIAGASGLLGRATAAHLRATGHEVLALVRREASGPDERRWDPDSGRIAAPGLADVDAVINFSGAGIADARWSVERKAELRSSRLNSTTTLAAALEPGGRCRRLLNGSAIGFYGDTGETMVDEGTPQGAGFLAQLVADWERAAHAAPVPTAYLRTGQVLTTEGGFLGKQRLPFQLGLGGRLGSGRQFLSWIHVDDYTRAIAQLLDSTLTGPVNLCGPNPVTNARFTAAFAQALNRPALIPIPLPALRLMFGSEMVDEALLSGTRVQPRRLLDDGFEFDHPELDEALASVARG